MGFRSALFFLGIGVALPPLPASSVVSAHVQVLVARPNGQVLGELRTRVGAVSWKHRGVGEVGLQLARTDAYFSEEMLRFGNRVLVQFSNGLPNWGGVIASPRPWDVGGVGVSVVQAKWLLGRRKTGWARVFSGATAGLVFESLMREAGVRHPLGVLVGTSPLGGAGYDLEFNSERLADVFDDLVELLDVDDWDVTGRLANGSIEFTANLYQQRGEEKGNVALSNGRRGNVGAVRFKEEAQIVNAWSLAGGGQGWGEGDRAYAFVVDGESVGRFGFSEDSLVVESATSVTSLEQIGRKLLGRTAWPHALVALEAADRSPGAFGEYDVGDVVSVDLWNYGFGGFRAGMRVVGREYFPERGACDLVLEEVV